MSFTIKDNLLISDLDGTLLDKNKIVSEKNLWVINDWVNKGGYFTIATGRNRISAYNRIKGLPINCPAILLNGCMLYDYSNQTYLNTAKLLGYLDVVNFVYKNYPQAGIEIISKNNTHVINGNGITFAHLNREGIPYEEIDINDANGDIGIKILIGIENKYINNLNENIKKILPATIYSVLTDPKYLELLPTGIDKGHALKKLKTLLNIKKVIAFGDYYNDIGMLDDADISFAMENAPQDVKVHSDYISKENHDDGIFHSIEKLKKDKILI